MSTATIIIFAAVFIAGLSLGALIIWGILRRRKTVSAPEKTPDMAKSTPVVAKATPVTTPPLPLVFHMSSVIAPIILAVVCLIIAVAFVAFLPSPLPFRFTSNGTGRMLMNTYTFIGLMIVGQIICALAAWAIANTIIRMGRNAFKSSQPQVPLGAYISLMTNMVLLPQLILAYIMLDAFIYGVWTFHMVSVGVFSILTIAIGSLILIFMFMRLLSRANKIMNKR